MIWLTSSCQGRANTLGGKLEWSAASESASELISSSGLQSGEGWGGFSIEPIMEQCLHDIVLPRKILLFFSTCSAWLCIISLLWTRVLLRFICWVDDGDAVAVGAGGREGDLRRRKTVRRHDIWFGGCFCRWSSSGEVDDVAAGAEQTTQSSLRHLPDNWPTCIVKPYEFVSDKPGMFTPNCWQHTRETAKKIVDNNKRHNSFIPRVYSRPHLIGEQNSEEK